MIIINLLLCVFFLFILVQCAEYAIKYSSRIAKALRFPEFIVSFFIIALVSILPEATISVMAAFNGKPELGLGTLLGSNVADLALVVGIVALFSSKGIKVKSRILKNNLFYLILLLFPLILGFDGRFSRIEGLVLVMVGFMFFAKIYMENYKFQKKLNPAEKKPFLGSLFLLILSLLVLLLSAFFTVKFAVNFANEIKFPPILVGLTVLALGTCLPELIFSIRAVKISHDSLALGDILGTVIADATIVLGSIALIYPFSYNPYNIYLTGTAMFLAGIFVTTFMKSDKSISETEGVLLVLFYILFVFVEFFMNKMLL